MTSKPVVSLADVDELLFELHGEPVTGLEPLSGGFWSAAYAYAVSGRELVLRLSDVTEGFALDARAAELTRGQLPVPRIVRTGTALGTSYAVSERHHGQFLEYAAEPRVALEQLLAGLRQVPADPSLPVGLDGGGWASWREWLLATLADRPEQRHAGWRRALARTPDVEAVFVAAEQRIAELLERCPERRDLVHGDLLHRNVLISQDGARVTGVFSWKCAVRGDFLFDTAWCTFWSDWHPQIEAADAWQLTLASSGGPADLDDAGERHHCYELAIGAAHFGWYVWTGDTVNLERVAARVDTILTRGPRT